jgi:hypothetical protein
MSFLFFFLLLLFYYKLNLYGSIGFLKFFMSFFLYELNLIFELNTPINCNMKTQIKLKTLDNTSIYKRNSNIKNNNNTSIYKLCAIQVN